MLSSKADYVIIAVVAAIAYWLGSQNAFTGYSGSSSEIGGGDSGSSSTTRTDRATGISFPTRQKFHVSGSKQLTLVGVGTRKLAIINLYSMGVFVSNDIRKKIENLSSQQQQEDDEGDGGKDKDKGGKAICDTILQLPSPKVVQLTFAMGIGPEKIAQAVSQIANVNESVRTEFHDMLIDGMGGGRMQKGESMTFEWKGGSISATARGKFIGSIQDETLSQGVLSLYVGPKSVSPSLLDDLGCRS